MHNIRQDFLPNCMETLNPLQHSNAQYISQKKDRPKIKRAAFAYEYGSIYSLIKVAPNFLYPNVDACIT